MNRKRRKIVLYTVVLILVGVTASVIALDFYRENLEQKKEASSIKSIKTHNIEKKAVKKHDSNGETLKKAAALKQSDEVENARQAAQDYIGSKDVGVYCIELKTGKTFGINQDRIYYAASTGKLPEILYTQKKLDQGIITQDTKFPYHDYVNDVPGAMIRGGTGILKNNLQDGQMVDVGRLLEYACRNSDNLASNMLAYYVCDKNSGVFKDYISTVISRNIPVFSKNFSPKDIAVLMNALYAQGNKGGVQAISYLEHTDWDSVKIPKYIPVKVAHKIGINGTYNHDAAIVYAGNPYIISIMTRGENDEFISQLSKKIYDALN